MNPNISGVGLTLNLTKWTWAASGAATTHSSTGTNTYAINGKQYTKAAIAGGTTPTTDGNSGNAFAPILKNKGAAFVWAVDAAGTVKAFQGGIEDLDAAGAFVNAPQLPGLPDNACPVAYSIVKAGSTYAGTGFKFGTDNWNTTGMTVTHQDVMCLPARPQTA